MASEENTKIKNKIRNIYKKFFDEMSIDNKTGSISNFPNKKFSNYPYIGSNYNNQILFVGLDVGSDERKNTIQTFDSRRKAIENKNIDVHNPHIAGTLLTTIYFLKDEFRWNDLWNRIKNEKSSIGASKKCTSIPSQKF